MLDNFTDFNEKIVTIKAEIAELGPEDVEALGVAYFKLGEELQKVQSLQGFEQAVVAYERAVGFREQLPLEDENCNELARVYIGLGDALEDLGTGESLRRSRELYTQALELRKNLTQRMMNIVMTKQLLTGDVAMLNFT